MTAPVHVAAHLTTALELGDWSSLTVDRLQLVLDDSAAGAAERPLSCAAASMRLQAEGDVESAADELHEAAEVLPRAYRRRLRQSSGTRWYAVLAPPPGGDPARMVWTMWRLARVIARDQAGLAEHEAALMHHRMSAREAMIIATAEFLRWLDCDPFLPGRGPACARIDMQWRCSAATLRTTNLCRLADATAGDVGEGIWRGAGGEAHLKAAAYGLLARGELVPIHGPGALPPDVPVRHGRREAYRRACARRDDREYT